MGPSTAGVAFSFGGASDGSNRRGETLCVSAPEPRELVAYGFLNGAYTTRAIMFLLLPLLMGCTGTAGCPQCQRLTSGDCGMHSNRAAIRRVAILTGGDWDGASCEHLIVPLGCDLAAAKTAWRTWYETEYLPALRAKVACEYYPFATFLRLRFGGRIDTSIEECWNDA